ncbi:MAG: ABC transporter ATP-binding protein, partial [Acidimicrobiales bacterium]
DMAGERTLDCSVEPGSAADPEPTVGALGRLPAVDRVELLGDPGVAGWRLRVYVQGDAARQVAAVAQTIGEGGGRLTDVRLGEPTLEDVFIHLTGRSLR